MNLVSRAREGAPTNKGAADEQIREPERRSQADLQWTIFRRRPVTAGVRRRKLS